MTNYQPFISVIIPVYQDWNRLQKCLQALQKQSYPHNSFEVIIVNNELSSSTPDWPTVYGDLKISFVNEVMPGSYNARNTGIKYAKGSLIAFTDSDCQPTEDWIKFAVQCFQKDSTLDRVAGKISIYREYDASLIVWKYDSLSAFNQKFNVSQGASVTANLIVRKELFEKQNVGLFDSNLKSGGDVEWNQKATKTGFNIIYAEDVVVLHPSRKSWIELVNKSRRVAGGLFNKAKNRGGLLSLFFWHFLPPIRYFMVLLDDKNSFKDSIFATLIFLFLKMCMLTEFVRLLFGAKSLRQ